MVIYSVKLNPKKIAAVVVGVLLLGMMIFVNHQAHKADQITPEQSAAAAKMEQYTVTASNTQEQIAFLQQFGYACGEEPTAFSEIIIPSEFDGVYDSYNQLQKENGFDLTKYKGKRVKRYTYAITNYGDGKLQANMLIYNGNVVGGDVSSVEMNGFMEGFHTIENK